MTYHCEHFQGYGEGCSHHDTVKLQTMLNEHAKLGWELDRIMPVSIGYLLIFKKP